MHRDTYGCRLRPYGCSLPPARVAAVHETPLAMALLTMARHLLEVDDEAMLTMALLAMALLTVALLAMALLTMAPRGSARGRRSSAP